MAHMEPPSFSLGLDLDSRRNSPILHDNCNASLTPPSFSLVENGLSTITAMDSESEFARQVLDSDIDSRPEPPRILRRLRRGCVIEDQDKAGTVDGVSDDHNDEIEEFSSQEGIISDLSPSTQRAFSCGSSKSSLLGCGVLRKKPACSSTVKKKEDTSTAQASSSKSSHNTYPFPKLTLSPIRKFQLLDSDSDEPTIVEDKNSSMDRKNKKHKQNNGDEDDLWEGFYSVKSNDVETPILDEVCGEYFDSIRHKNMPRESSNHPHNEIFGDECGCCDEGSSTSPPSHHYFFHCDPRVRAMVRDRLPHFFPLGAPNNQVNLHQCGIDYMRQFGGGASEGDRRPRNKDSRTAAWAHKIWRENPNENTCTSQGSVNPTHNASFPVDAAKRRVQAGNQGVGRWYTSPEGKKVYVSKTGQKLTGRTAYLSQRKENAGFRRKKPMKRTSSGKKSSAKKRKR